MLNDLTNVEAGIVVIAYGMKLMDLSNDPKNIAQRAFSSNDRFSDTIASDFNSKYHCRYLDISKTLGKRDDGTKESASNLFYALEITEDGPVLSDAATVVNRCDEDLMLMRKVAHSLSIYQHDLLTKSSGKTKVLLGHTTNSTIFSESRNAVRLSIALLKQTTQCQSKVCLYSLVERYQCVTIDWLEGSRPIVNIVDELSLIASELSIGIDRLKKQTNKDDLKIAYRAMLVTVWMLAIEGSTMCPCFDRTYFQKNGSDDETTNKKSLPPRAVTCLAVAIENTGRRYKNLFSAILRSNADSENRSNVNILCDWYMSSGIWNRPKSYAVVA